MIFDIDNLCKNNLILRFKFRQNNEKKKFSFLKSKHSREIYSCPLSNHFYSLHTYDIEKIYSGEYNEINYRNKLGIRNEFNKIINLPKENSDNKNRVANLSSYFDALKHEDFRVLDVGSGIGVFPFEMKNIGWNIEAVDPDKNSVNHLEEILKVKCHHCFFQELYLKQKYDLITFNKVIEHVKNPLSFLLFSKNLLNLGGYIYIEVPDGVQASQIGKDRNEFALEHFHAFSIRSTAALIAQSGFSALRIERLIEPSGKFTIRAIAKLNAY